MAQERQRSKKAGYPYHRGNLAAALVKAGLLLIEKKGLRALTLREIGKRTGVSRTAAYRHFSGKEDLVVAMRESALEQLADSLDQARSKAGKIFALRLKAMALAYVGFAVDHPALFEVMFGGGGNQLTHRNSEDARAFRIFEQTIREGQQSGDVRAGDSVLLARLVWAQIHGVSLHCVTSDLVSESAGTLFVEFCSEVLEKGLARL